MIKVKYVEINLLLRFIISSRLTAHKELNFMSMH